MRSCDSAESSEQREVRAEEDLTAELREFINQLIVPLLVERLMQLGHLYTAAHSSYDDEGSLEAVKEAA